MLTSVFNFENIVFEYFFFVRAWQLSGVGNSMTHMEKSLLITVWSNSTFRLVSGVLIGLTFKFFCQP